MFSPFSIFPFCWSQLVGVFFGYEKANARLKEGREALPSLVIPTLVRYYKDVLAVLAGSGTALLHRGQVAHSGSQPDTPGIQ